MASLLEIVVNGAVNSVDGTSASTPTWAAQVAMLNSLRLSKGLPPMGLVNPFIYSSADLFKGTFPSTCAPC